MMSGQVVPNVPAVPVDPMFHMQGDQCVLTSVGKSFFETLINYFYTNHSSEGLVAATQPAANVASIQNNTLPNGSYTCQYGTFLYDSTLNNLVVCLNNGSNVPQFYSIMTGPLGATPNMFLLL